MNTLAFFEIQSNSPEHEAEFYRSVFGWKIERDKNIPIEYWRIETEGIQGAILQRAAALVPMSGTNAYCCSFEVESFDKMAEKILSLGGIVAVPKMAVLGRCWQGYFLDPDQNVFGIFEADENAK